MPKTRPPYTPEFRQQLIELVAAGRTPVELSREFEPSAPTIRNWATQAARSGTPAMRSRAARLLRELAPGAQPRARREARS